MGDTAASVAQASRDTLWSIASGAASLGAGALTAVVEGAWIVVTFVSRTAGRIAEAGQRALPQALSPARPARSSRRARRRSAAAA